MKQDGAEQQSETRGSGALLGEQSRTLEGRHGHRHRHASPGATKEKEETLGPPNKRKHNSTWVETVTKSKDHKAKHAPVGGESALEVRGTWISK